MLINMKTLFTILFLFLLTGCSQGDSFGANDSVSLTEVKIIETKIGDKYALKYVNNTTQEIEEFEVTKAEYEDVTNSDAQPEKNGYTFEGGYGGKPIIATSSPILEDNQYLDLGGDIASGTAIIIIKLNGKSPTIINKNLITGNKISQTIINTL